MPNRDEAQHDIGIREILDEREASLVEQVIEVLSEHGRAEGLSHIERGLERLRGLWQAIEAFPRLHHRQTLGSRRRDLETLLDTFTKTEPYSVEAFLPTRAVLARGYGMAKFNFCRMLVYVIDEHLEPSEQHEQLVRRGESAARSAAATLVGEDVLRSIASDTNLDIALRRRATRVLAALWDQRATQGIADFAPLLDSAWRAKASVEICYGTLLGVTELMHLITAGLEPEFIDCFGGECVSQDQYSAFEEFVFNATYEQLGRMRQFMREQNHPTLDAESVARLFDVGLDRLHRTTNSPEDVFYTFREREMWATMRRVRGLPGPKKTAEEYVMISVLGRSED